MDLKILAQNKTLDLLNSVLRNAFEHGLTTVGMSKLAKMEHKPTAFIFRRREDASTKANLQNKVSGNFHAFYKQEIELRWSVT